MKKILGFVFIMLSVMCIRVPLAGEAAVRYETTAIKGKTSVNRSAGNYSGNWSEPSRSFLYHNADGTYNRVECIGKYIYSEIYTADFKYKSRKKIKLELPVWGGVYMSGDAYYVMLGQNNEKEKKGVSEFRLIKYNKNWKKVTSVNITDANTTGPFEAGSCRFAQIEGNLYVRTCHKMYKSDDGLNHQASVMFRFSMTDLTVLASYTDVANSEYSYISHSFNQFLAVGNGKLYACDHGDAFNRAITVMRFDEAPSGKGYFDNKGTVVGDVYSFYGNTGDNYTGATLGGFAVSGTHCIVVGNSVKQTKQGRNSSVRNIYTISAEASGDLQKSEKTWITNYSSKGKRTACNPLLVQVSDQRHLLIWEEEYNGGYDRTRYVFLDGTGKKISGVGTVYMPLSDCQPIVSGKRIVWYVTDHGAPTFYSIPVDGSAISRPAAKTKFTKNGIVYQITKSGKAGGEVSVTGCKKSQMPKEISLNTVDYEGYRFRVTVIGKNAFKNNKKLTWVRIGTYVKKIGAGAFQGCSKINTIELGYKKYTTKNIGKKAFAKTKGLVGVGAPGKKITAYRKLLGKRGVSPKVMFYKN